MLTDTKIRTAKAAEKVVNLNDGKGLYVRVYPTGAKKFMLRSSVGGSSRWVTLGEYPAVSLSDARHLALEQSGKVLPERRTAGEAYEEWFRQVVPRRYKRPALVMHHMEKNFLPAFADQPLRKLTKLILLNHLTSVAARAPCSANRYYTVLRVFFDYCTDRGWTTASPLLGVSKKSVGGKEIGRDRVLKDAELLRLHDLSATMLVPQAQLWLSIIALTGQRSGEVKAILRSEVAGQVWTIPRDKNKSGLTDHTVCLSRPVALLLERAFVLYGDAPFGTRSRITLSKAMAKMKFDPKATPHDLRRTMATRLADMGVMPHVIEKCLNHKMPGVMAVYNRAEYVAEKKAAWRLWAKYLLALKRKPRSIHGA